MKLDFKHIPFEVKDIDQKKGIFTGYFSSFGNRDAGGDTVLEGAFTKSFKEWGPGGKNRIKCLWAHDFFQPIGKPLVLKEDSYGAFHETKVAMTTLGKDTLTLIEEGVVTEHSFGYQTIKAEPDGRNGRLLKELKVYEYSVLILGMNSETPIIGTKSLTDPSQIQKRMKVIDNVIRKGLMESEDLIAALEMELKSWQEAMSSYNTDPQKEVIHVTNTPTEKKAFAQRLAQESVYTEFWLYNDVLRWEIMKAMRDGTDINAVVSQISTDIDEYKNTVLDWAQRSFSTGQFGQKNMDQLLAAGIEFEKKNPITDLIATQLGMSIPDMQVKSEPVNPEPPATEPPVEDPDAVAIKALLGELKPDTHLGTKEAADDLQQDALSFLNELQKELK